MTVPWSLLVLCDHDTFEGQRDIVECPSALILLVPIENQPPSGCSLGTLCKDLESYRLRLSAKGSHFLNVENGVQRRKQGLVQSETTGWGRIRNQTSWCPQSSVGISLLSLFGILGKLNSWGNLISRCALLVPRDWSPHASLSPPAQSLLSKHRWIELNYAPENRSAGNS